MALSRFRHTNDPSVYQEPTLQEMVDFLQSKNIGGIPSQKDLQHLQFDQGEIEQMRQWKDRLNQFGKDRIKRIDNTHMRVITELYEIFSILLKEGALVHETELQIAVTPDRPINYQNKVIIHQIEASRIRVWNVTHDSSKRELYRTIDAVLLKTQFNLNPTRVFAEPLGRAWVGSRGGLEKYYRSIYTDDPNDPRIQKHVDGRIWDALTVLDGMQTLDAMDGDKESHPILIMRQVNTHGRSSYFSEEMSAGINFDSLSNSDADAVVSMVRDRKQAIAKLLISFVGGKI